MTNEQIKELALKAGFKLKEQPDGELDLNPYVYTAVKKCIEFNEQLKNNGWISVDDELPKPMRKVLVCGETYKEKNIIEVSYHAPEFIAEFGVDSSFLSAMYVSHWQPLPEPPEEQ